MAVLAGVITVLEPLTIITAVKVTAEGFGAAMFDGPHGLPLTRKYLLPIFILIGWPVTAEDLG
jgi:hypothetical protein